MTPEELGAMWHRSSEILVVTDGAGAVTECNPAAHALGFSPGQRIGAVSDRVVAAALARMAWDASSGRTVAGEVELDFGGGPQTLALQVIPLGEGRIAWSGRDVTQERKLALVREQAIGRDPLTSLPNRALWNDRLDHALKQGRRTNAGIGMMFIDLDDFKAINDSQGHGFGDQVLIEVSRRLSHAIRPGDTLARLGGDEFIVLCVDVPGVREMQRLGERLADAVGRTPIIASGQSVMVSCSVGVTFARAAEVDAELFMRTADNAMYQAKRLGPGQTANEAFLRTSERMVAGVQRSIELGTLPMGSQPVIATQSGRVQAQAVDVRLNRRPHAEHALRTLEANPSVMRGLASLAMRQTIALLQADPAATVQVRLPMIALTDPRCLESLQQLFIDHRIDPHRVVLAVDAAGARSERTLVQAKEAADLPLSFGLARFGLHSVDLGALSDLSPAVCELDPAFVRTSSSRSDVHRQAACEVAHIVGARTQVPSFGGPAGGAAIDQIRQLPGKTLQPAEPLSIGH